MKQIRQGEAFRKEKNSILIQFVLFNLAFFSRAIFFAIELNRIFSDASDESEYSRQTYDTALA